MLDAARREEWTELSRVGLRSDDELTVDLAVGLAGSLALLEQWSADENIVEVELDTDAVDRARELNADRPFAEAARGHEALRLLQDGVWECDACDSRGDVESGPTPEQLPCLEPEDEVAADPVVPLAAEAAARRGGSRPDDRQVMAELGMMLLEARQRSEYLRGTLGYIARYARGEAELYQSEGLGSNARAWRFIASAADEAAGSSAMTLAAAEQLRELARGETLERAIESLRQLSEQFAHAPAGSEAIFDWRPVVALLAEYDRHRGLL